MTLRIGHLSDLHLGYRAHAKLAPSGANQRSVDVALAFRSAVDGILEAGVDIVLCGGDLFHEPKPSNHAVLFAFAQFERLQAAGIPVVLVAGNHDTPRRADTGCILRLFEKCGVQVADFEACAFTYPALGLRVVAAPHTAVAQGEVPRPEGPERFQVLLAHAEVQGAYRKDGERASGQLPAAVLTAPWSAVCLGDYHISHQVAPGVWYSGSTEFTSSNPWAEAGTPKGWLLWDLEAGTVEPQPIPLARLVLDLEPIDATDLTPAQVDAAIAERLGAQDIRGAIVRLVVNEIPVEVSRDLAHDRIRASKATALHLNLDLRRPEIVHSVAAEEFLAMRRQPFGEMYSGYMAKRTLTPGLDRAAFLALAQTTLDETEREYTEPGAKRGAA